MADINMQREHTLGLPAARQLANSWLAQAEERLGMQCTYQEGASCDTISFERPGVTGTVQVTADRFVLDAELGFMFSAFKGKIESEVTRRFDKMLAQAAGAASTATTA